jgi:hypothetical protein
MEELMKPANVSLPRELKNSRSLQKRQGNLDVKTKLKERSTRRQQIGLNNNAGHVRGGHSFH